MDKNKLKQELLALWEADNGETSLIKLLVETTDLEETVLIQNSFNATIELVVDYLTANYRIEKRN